MIKNNRVAVSALASASLLAALATYIVKDEGTGPTYLEGNQLVYVAYPDPAHGWKVPTICNGRTRGVFKGMEVSEAQCKLWLYEELSLTVLSALERNVKVPLTQNQAVALGRFVDNLGETTFRQSQLLRNINRGDCYGAAEEWNNKPQLNKDGSVKVWNKPSIIDRQTKVVLLAEGDTIKKFTTAGGVPLAGLIKRRADERAQWEADCDVWY